MAAAKDDTMAVMRASITKDGAYSRATSNFRGTLSDPVADSSAPHPFTMEAGRYILYVAHACPWASRTVLVRELLKLDNLMEMFVVHPTWQNTRPGEDSHCGWVFAPTGTGLKPVSEGADPERRVVSAQCTADGGPHGVKTLRELYERAGQGDYMTKRFSTPVLWDREKDAIVSNESADIISAFNAWAQWRQAKGGPAVPDLEPTQLQGELEEVNAKVYDGLNNGVYRCGFATSQGAYQKAVQELVSTMGYLTDRITSEEKKSGKPYLGGGVLTLADIRAFVTLIRMDDVYVCYFKTGVAALHKWPVVERYVAFLLRTHPELVEKTYMDEVMAHYYTSHPRLNWFTVIPEGQDTIKRLLQLPVMLQ